MKARTSRLLSVVAGTVAVAGVLGVVSAAFALSFDAIRAVAVAAHITPSLSWLFPVAVDGAMSVATVCAVVMRSRGRSAAYPWAVVLFGALVSVVANALHAHVGGGAVALPGPWAVALSAVPPVLLALSVHLLIVLALSVESVSDTSADATVQSDTSSDMSATADATVATTSSDSNSDVRSGSGSDIRSDVRSGSDSDKPATAARPRPRRTATQRQRQRRSTYDAVAEAYRRDASFNVAALAAELGVSRRTVERHRETAKQADELLSQADALLSTTNDAREER